MGKAMAAHSLALDPQLQDTDPPEGPVIGDVMTTTTTGLEASLLELIRVTSTVLPQDVRTAVNAARKVEEDGSNAAYALEVIDCNIDLAKDQSQPLCQDTGSVLVYVDCPVGYDQLAFQEAFTAMVKEATDSVTCDKTASIPSPASIPAITAARRPELSLPSMAPRRGPGALDAQGRRLRKRGRPV